jgi:two-component system cell cycle sensor histidine kinase/response regulator CckA
MDEASDPNGGSRDAPGRRREDALRDAEAVAEALVRGIPDLVFRLDARGVVTDYRTSHPELLSVPPEVFLGHTSAEVLPRDVAETVDTALRRVLETGEVEGLEYRLPIGGKQHEFEARCVPLGDSEALLVVRDVTQRRQLEAQLRQSQRMESIGLLAGGIAHDFNNLVTVITGYCDVALRRMAPDDPNRDQIREVRRAGERAAALTRQLLAFSRKQVLHPRTFDLEDTVAELEKMLRRLIGENIDLCHERAGRRALVTADPGQIEQVIVNLAINARDAMPDGGTLSIEVSHVRLDPERDERFDVKAGDYVRLAVMDTGTGMDESTAARAFEPFFTTKEVGRGTGLGLSTVYGIVKQSDGYIWIDSVPGQGTTVEVYLPAVDVPADAAGSDAAGVGRSGHETILVAEDEAAVRSLVSRVLETAGYKVLEAANGKEALAHLAAAPGAIDLVISDVVMPHMGGRELVRLLKSQDRSPMLLLMSGYTDDETVHRAIAEAKVDLIEKPFLPDDLLRKVREILDGR